MGNTEWEISMVLIFGYGIAAYFVIANIINLLKGNFKKGKHYVRRKKT